ncbi:MAG TPA: hypothetical protein VFA18_09780 [Gemmataceae bacterium]|nr:hypothetical protein [Gemmataceae bacterium]
MRRPPKRLSAKLRQEAAHWLNKQWESERGIENTDYNNTLVLVQAPVQETAQFLAGKPARWERDVLGHEIIMADPSLLIFRLRGQDWTEVLSSDDDYSWRQALSRRLGVRVIHYSVSDTVGYVGYELCHRGRTLETYSATEGQRPVFHSKIRPNVPRATGGRGEWAHAFFVEQSAFEPFLAFDYFFGYRRPAVGERVIVQNPGHIGQIDANVEVCTWPPMERVDYVVLKRSPERRVRKR